jgi:hypothetical protein
MTAEPRLPLVLFAISPSLSRQLTPAHRRREFVLGTHSVSGAAPVPPPSEGHSGQIHSFE